MWSAAGWAAEGLDLAWRFPSGGVEPWRGKTPDSSGSERAIRAGAIGAACGPPGVHLIANLHS
jgi:hypothetical protein